MRRLIAGVLLALLASSAAAAYPPALSQNVPESAFRSVEASWAPTMGPTATPHTTPRATTPARSTPRPPSPTPRPPAPPTSSVTLVGIASWYSSWCNCTAMRQWRGKYVRVTGPMGSVVVKITDYGPALWTHRLIDLNPMSFVLVCGLLSRGVCGVTVTATTQ